MGQSKKKNLNRSELCPDVLRCVFVRLSFTDLNRAKSVCSWWHSASKRCVPKRNQIPWLILFPRIKEANHNDSRCVLFVPDDRDKVYKTRDLGVDFVRSRCLATYGSWLLMMDNHWDLNILNPLTGERIDLPLTEYDRDPPQDTPPLLFDMRPEDMCPSIACLWIDDRSKDYVVVWKMVEELVFAKKGNNTWRRIFPTYDGWEGEQLSTNTSLKKLYYLRNGNAVNIWCLSGDDPQQVFEYYALIKYVFRDFLPDRSKDEELYRKEYVDSRLSIAVSTVSGQVLKVASAVKKSKRWLFRIYKMNPIKLCWEVIDSLGDEALILDMGLTVVAKDIPGFKRNSIYISGLDYGRKNPDHIFVFDLTTHKTEPLPQSVFSSIHFSDARWFFPGFNVDPAPK